MRFGGVGHRALLAGLLVGPLTTGIAAAQETSDRDTVFVLGRFDSGISDSDGQAVNVDSVSAEEMQKYDLASADEAVNHIAGANASNTGGSRNERLIYVRGFDRFQTTLSIDGVRVYLPADNRTDFARFLTADLAEVQVSKGYVSVLNGPGSIGGAVNLVTRKPSKALDAELSTTMTTDGDFNDNGYTVSGLIGTRQDSFYLQASGATTDRDSWTMSEDFWPVVPALENGGERGNSASSDWRVNLKAGWTPNATDEYAISYIKQSGEKNAPYHVSDNASTRFWTWPYWDIESVAFLSRTQLGEGLQLRSRVYYNTFENLLSSFDNAAQNTQSLPRAFDSYYDDTAYGANVTLEAKLGDSNTLTGAMFYRKDEHNERQDGFVRTPPAPINPSINSPYAEPWQNNEEDTYSIALEDVQKLGPDLDLVLGASYDWTNLINAADVNVAVTGTTIANSVISFQPVNYQTNDMNATNYQAALVWRAGDDTRLHVSASSRTRFPSLFERFSSRFGTAIPNPNVDPERALNLEAGGSWQFPGLKLDGAVFYSDLTDALIQIPVNVGAPFGVVNQTKNAGDGEYYGLEVSVAGQLFDNVELGGNLTLLHRELTDPTNAAFQPQGVPESKAFIYADWSVAPGITVTPSIDIAGARWTVTSSSAITPPRFYETGTYTLVNLSVAWDINDSVSLLLAGKNLGDQNYVLVDGFPEEGRNYALTLRLRN